MRLAAALLADASPAIPSWLRAATMTRFSLARDPHVALDGTAMLESCFASPGRYVGEMLRRLRRDQAEARRYLVCNPYVTLAPHLVDELIVRSYCMPVDEARGFVLFADDKTALPLAYAFSADVADDAPAQHFGLLTTFDAAVDERLLRASFGAGVRVDVPLRWPSDVAPAANGYWPLSPALAHATIRAAERLEARPLERADRLHGERIAVIGYHAGDVLFWSQALGLVDSGVSAFVTLAPYADIARWARPDIATWTATLPTPYRPGVDIRDEHAHLWSCVLALADPEPRFWHLYRPFRDYRPPHHHLRESMAFALGGPGHGPRQPPALPPAGEWGTLAPIPSRIVVHFEGGWKLKELPTARRGPLLRKLQAAGFAPVILGKPEPSCPDVPALPYTDLASFRVLVGSAVALLGTDSFPAHCAQVLGIPTVQLFGSTLPAHACGVESPRYRLLHKPLPCVPCVDQTLCALDGGNVCHAHADDDTIVAALRDLAADAAVGNADAPALRAFPSGTPMPEADRDRFLDALFAEVTFEELTACPLCGAAAHAAVGERFRLPIAACDSCGLWFVRRRITEADLPKLYRETYWTDFMRLHGYPPHVERYRYDYFAAAERVDDVAAIAPAGSAVLDIGCALGTLPRRLREHGFASAGLELDATLAQKTSVLSGVPVYTSLQALTSAPRFSLVSMFDVFEHLYDPVAYLRALLPFVADDAVLLLETFRTDSQAFTDHGIDHEDVKPLEHPYMYRSNHITELLVRAGLTPFRVTYPEGEAHARIRIAARWNREPQS